jgi:hypothetical protein
MAFLSWLGVQMSCKEQFWHPGSTLGVARVTLRIAMFPHGQGLNVLVHKDAAGSTALRNACECTLWSLKALIISRGLTAQAWVVLYIWDSNCRDSNNSQSWPGGFHGMDNDNDEEGWEEALGQGTNINHAAYLNSSSVFQLIYFSKRGLHWLSTYSNCYRWHYGLLLYGFN